MARSLTRDPIRRKLRREKDMLNKKPWNPNKMEYFYVHPVRDEIRHKFYIHGIGWLDRKHN